MVLRQPELQPQPQTSLSALPRTADPCEDPVDPQDHLGTPPPGVARPQHLQAQLGQLYDTLIGPVERYLPGKEETLAIIPDGALWGVPWCGLWSSAHGYLVERYNVFCVPPAPRPGPGRGWVAGRYGRRGTHTVVGGLLTISTAVQKGQEVCSFSKGPPLKDGPQAQGTANGRQGGA